MHAISSNIASHSWKNDHRIDFEKWEIINKENYRIREIIE